MTSTHHVCAAVLLTNLRVLISACRRCGCSGVGVEIFPDCLEAARDLERREGSGSMREEQPALNLTWVQGDCAADPELLGRLVREHGVTTCYLYVYPTFLDVLQPQIEALSQAGVVVVSVGYHFPVWDSQYSMPVPTQPPSELRLLSPFSPSSSSSHAQLTAAPAAEVYCSNCEQVQPAGKRFHSCTGCKVVVYCSKACQKQHWKSGHKTFCKESRQWASEESALATKPRSAQSPRLEATTTLQ